MNITFLIGNGFDINLGLNTRYLNFYPFFVANSKETNMIRKWLKKDKLVWADLEEQLGKKLENVKEHEEDKFYEDKAELDRLLLEYLGREQKRVSIQNKEKEISTEFARSLKTFDSNLPEEGKESIQSTCDTYKKGEFKYCFICFNYTDTLDKIVNITRKLNSPIATHRCGSDVYINSLGPVLHIHGTLNEEMILGVNDIDQVNSAFLKNDSEFLDTFIKKRMNNSIGQRKTEHAQKLIEASHIICIFGMSIGSTDKMWWEEIVKWMNASDDNKLVIYYKGNDELNRKLPVHTIRLDNKLKREILEKGGADTKNPNIDKIKKRIFISYNADIFNFKEIFFRNPS